MKRLLLGKTAVLAVTTVLAGAVFVGCSTKSEPTSDVASPGEESKNVSLALEIAPQANVSSVHYIVTNATGGVVKSGDIPVPGGEETFVFGLTLPVGGPYTIALSAGSATISCVGTTGPFSISSTAQASITASMTCRDISQGDVNATILVTSTACPALSMNYIVATPSSANVGSQIAVLSSATDSNGTTPAYAWTVSPTTAGTFTGGNAANATFNCAAGGPATLKVTASIVTDDGACSDSLTVPVTCNNVRCGNGVRDPDESCDASAGDVGCPSDCTVSCGDGAVEYTEQCEPPNTATCTSTCATRVRVCGDGFVQSPEQCDDGNTVSGDGCQSDCTLPAAARCGDATLQSGEECESPVSVNPFNGNGSCSNDCQTAASASCLTCENNGPCVDLVFGCRDFPTAAGRTACYNLLECFRDNPTCGATAPEPCYCGSVPPGQCSALPPFPAANAPAGPCARQFEAAMGSSTPATVLVNFSNLSQPGAFATQRLLCDEALCPTECF